MQVNKGEGSRFGKQGKKFNKGEDSSLQKESEVG